MGGVVSVTVSASAQDLCTTTTFVRSTQPAAWPITSLYGCDVMWYGVMTYLLFDRMTCSGRLPLLQLTRRNLPTRYDGGDWSFGHWVVSRRLWPVLSYRMLTTEAG